MLIKLSVLPSLLFAALYPLCFWINFREPLKQNFHRFHLGLPCFLAGVVIGGMVFFNIVSEAVKLIAAGWVVAFLWVTFYYWKKDYPQPFLMTLLSLGGIYLIFFVQKEWGIGTGVIPFLINIYGGMVLCAAVFAMNLGHWYLNVHGLSLTYLRRASYLFWGLAAGRIVLDGILLFTQNVIYDGEKILLIRFLFTLDGYLLWLGLFFGTFFPVVALSFVRGALLLKNTQSATGILYAILCAVLVGELTYRYYLLKFHIPL